MNKFLYKAEDLPVGARVRVVDGHLGLDVSLARVVSHTPAEGEKPDTLVVCDLNDQEEKTLVLLGDDRSLFHGWRVLYNDPIAQEMVYSTRASAHFYQLASA